MEILTVSSRLNVWPFYSPGYRLRTLRLARVPQTHHTHSLTTDTEPRLGSIAPFGHQFTIPALRSAILDITAPAEICDSVRSNGLGMSCGASFRRRLHARVRPPVVCPWSYLASPLPPGSEGARPRLKNVCRSGDSAEFLAAQAPGVEYPRQLALVLHE